MSVYDDVKSLVPVREAAEMYGYSPNRSGFICCPFHGERTPSLKLYDGDRGFYCFGCGKGGSVVDFVGELFGLSPLDAVRKLNDDFRLGLPLDGGPSDRQTAIEVQQRKRAVETMRLFDDWRERTTNELSAAYRTGWMALRDRPPEKWTEGDAAAVRLLPVLEAWADVLAGDDFDEIVAVFREREKVKELCTQILGNTSTKSGMGWKKTA